MLWPLARRSLPDGAAITLSIEQEHQEINQLWTGLERLAAGVPERPALVERIGDLLRQDARDEEDELLPRLQQRLSPRQLRRAGRRWAAVRRVAPTRPHPTVARRPPGNVVSALPLSILDRTRDVLERGARAQPRAERWLTAISRRLAAVSAQVERLPVMTRGEDSSTAARR